MIQFCEFSGIKDSLVRQKSLEWPHLLHRLSRHAIRPANAEGKQAAGPLWSPTIYLPGVDRRGSEGVEAVTCFVADVDDGTTPDTISGRWYDRSYPDGDDIPTPLRWVIHSSFRHRPESPRWRAVFPLARPVPAADWPRVWRKLNHHIMGGHCDPAAKDPGRIYFWPACPDLELAFWDGEEGSLLDPDWFADIEEVKPTRRFEPSSAPAVPRPGREMPFPDERERLGETLLTKYVGMARPGKRNQTAFDLALQLRDNGFSDGETMGYLDRFKSAMGAGFDDDMAHIFEQVNKRSPRAAWEPLKKKQPLQRKPRPDTPAERARQDAIRSLEMFSGTSEIEVAGRQDREIIEDAWVALEMANEAEPVIFSRGRSLVLLACDINGNPYTQPLTPDLLSFALRRCADWVRQIPETDKITKKVSYKSIPARLPSWVAIDMLSDPTGPARMPMLRGVVSSPVVTAAGDLLLEPGYDEASGLYLAQYPNKEHCATAAEMQYGSETPSNAVDALSRLFAVFEEFPYAAPGDRANAIGMLLTPFLRHYIAGPAPLFVVEAPSPGTGKTLLASSLLAVSTPGRIITDGPSERERGASEEWSKHLGALLASSPAAVLLDNLRGMIASGTLEGLLTSPDRVSVRILGKSEMQMIDVSGLTMAATGNNALFQHDMARRSCFIRLDAGIERPEERGGFAVADLGAWVRDKRGEMLSDVLIILSAWIAAGRPMGRAQKGSFERWAGVLSGVLELLGVGEFLATDKERSANSDPETLAWRSFFGAWWERFGDAPTTAKALCFDEEKRDDGRGGEYVVKRPGLAIEHDIVSDTPGAARALGNKLKIYRDRVFAGYQLTAKTDRDDVLNFRLKRVQSEPAEPAEPAGDPVVTAERASEELESAGSAGSAGSVYHPIRERKTEEKIHTYKQVQTEPAEPAEPAEPDLEPASINSEPAPAKPINPSALSTDPVEATRQRMRHAANEAVRDGRMAQVRPDFDARWRELGVEGVGLKAVHGAAWETTQRGAELMEEFMGMARWWAGYEATEQAKAKHAVSGETVRAGVGGHPARRGGGSNLRNGRGR